MAIPDPTQSYLQGFQIGANLVNQRMANEQRMQELRSMDAARRAQERATAQALAMKLEERDREIQYSADMSKAMGAFEAASVPFIPIPGGGSVPNPLAMPEDQAFKRTILQVVGKYQPDKVGPLLMDMELRKVQMETQKRMGAAAEARAKGSSFTPSAGEVTMPDGSKKAFVKTSNGAVQLVNDPSIQNLTNPDTGETTPVLRIGNSAKTLPQDINARQKAQMERQSKQKVLSWALEHAPELMVEGPDGIPTLTPGGFNEAARRSAVTTGTRTAAEKNLVDTQKTITALNDVEKSLRPQDVGVRGVLGDELLDTWLPQFGFKTADVQRMDNRTKLKSLIEGAIREVSVDNRFSNADRIDIKKVLPKAGVKESYENAIQTTRTLKNIFAKRAMIDAQTIGKSTPPWAANALDREKLIEANDAGLVDDDALIDAAKIGKITTEEAIDLQLLNESRRTRLTQ